MLTTLENAVMTGTPEEAAEICKNLPKDEKWERARGLALACRFRGLEYVRALAENGAAIGRWQGLLWFALLDINRAVRQLVEDRHDQHKYVFAETLEITDKNGAPKTLKLLPTKSARKQ